MPPSQHHIRNENAILAPWSGGLPPLQLLERGIEGVRKNPAPTSIFTGGETMPIHEGDTASRTQTITEEAVIGFAEIVNDHNPVHLDDDYAATTPFGKRIAHGMLVASVISAALANDLPGPGTIYLGQELSFKKPVFLGDTVTATLTCTSYRESRRIATIETIVTNQDGVVVIEGKATVMLPAVD